MSSLRSVPLGGLVCVTGASGYIASYIIEQLLTKGYRVRGVVRDIKREDKYNHLKEIPQVKGQLEFVEADLEAGKYDDILQGCDALIHTATPYIYTAQDPQKEIVDPAIRGTVDSIKASIKSKTVKRVVITSSGGSIFSFPVQKQNYVFGEKDWNTTSSLTNNPYFYSKRLAEEAAWNLWKEHKDEIDVVVVNPLFVVGPPKVPILNSSLINVKKHLMSEVQTIVPAFVGWVDVRDVATAHLIGLEHPNAVGRRLICCSEMRSWKAMADTLKKQFPDYPVVHDPEEKGTPYSFDTSLLREFGLTNYRSFETMLHDTVEAFIKLGVVPDLRKK